MVQFLRYLFIISYLTFKPKIPRLSKIGSFQACRVVQDLETLPQLFLFSFVFFKRGNSVWRKLVLLYVGCTAALLSIAEPFLRVDVFRFVVRTVGIKDLLPFFCVECLIYVLDNPCKSLCLSVETELRKCESFVLPSYCHFISNFLFSLLCLTTYFLIFNTMEYQYGNTFSETQF